MPHQDPIALWLATSVAGGLAAHVVIAAWSRRSYRRLRAAYVGAVAAAQHTGDAHALVRALELHRQFIHTPPPGWLMGLRVHLRAALVLFAIVGITLMIAMGRLPPALAGVALLFAIGLRRILLVTLLLLALFAVSSLMSGPTPSDANKSATAAHRTEAQDAEQTLRPGRAR